MVIECLTLNTEVLNSRLRGKDKQVRNNKPACHAEFISASQLTKNKLQHLASETSTE